MLTHMKTIYNPVIRCMCPSSWSLVLILRRNALLILSSAAYKMSIWPPVDITKKRWKSISWNLWINHVNYLGYAPMQWKRKDVVYFILLVWLNGEDELICFKSLFSTVTGMMQEKPHRTERPATTNDTSQHPPLKQIEPTRLDPGSLMIWETPEINVPFRYWGFIASSYGTHYYGDFNPSSRVAVFYIRHVKGPVGSVDIRVGFRSRLICICLCLSYVKSFMVSYVPHAWWNIHMGHVDCVMRRILYAQDFTLMLLYQVVCKTQKIILPFLFYRTIILCVYRYQRILLAQREACSPDAHVSIYISNTVYSDARYVL